MTNVHDNLPLSDLLTLARKDIDADCDDPGLPGCFPGRKEVFFIRNEVYYAIEGVHGRGFYTDVGTPYPNLVIDGKIVRPESSRPWKKAPKGRGGIAAWLFEDGTWAWNEE